MLEFSLDDLGIRLIFPPAGFRESSRDFPLAGRFLPEKKPRAAATLHLLALNPAEDPFPLTPGQELPIQVRRKGNRLDFLSSGCRAEYDLKNREGKIRVFPDRLPDSLDNFLRVIYSYFLLERGGFLLHAFGFSWKGFAHILFGPSGSGKSTAAGFFPEILAGSDQGMVLSDDVIQVVALPDKEGFQASRPLLESRFAPCDSRWPVKSVFLLVKDRRDFILPSEPAVSSSRLLANILYVSEDPETVPELLKILEKFVQACPVGELHFRPVPGFYKLII